MRAVPSIALLLLTSCGLSMTQQPKYNTYAPADIWPDGASARRLPDGVVSQSEPARLAPETSPPPATEALLQRGRERFDIYCSPCHGLAGDGPAPRGLYTRASSGLSPWRRYSMSATSKSVVRASNTAVVMARFPCWPDHVRFDQRQGK